jgi:hypothetical protein
MQFDLAFGQFAQRWHRNFQFDAFAIGQRCAFGKHLASASQAVFFDDGNDAFFQITNEDCRATTTGFFSS